MTKQSLSLGALELFPDGTGFIRFAANSYLPGPQDIFVSRQLIRQHGLRRGDELHGNCRNGGKTPALETITEINGQTAASVKKRPNFKKLTVIHPEEQLLLECGLQRLGRPDYTNRIIDLLCPFGKGQRALIVAPPKAGKTMVLQAIAEGITKNHPECTLFILLVDERPEEISEMKSCGFGEVIASSFDFPTERHVKLTEMTLARAHRRAEMGQDVVIVLDSLTRLARAYNTEDRTRGSKTLSGGLGSSAMEKPKRFFGSARKIENGGSVTIIATALIDTGSRMDQVIFEEFKGTGNSELLLDRELSNRRIFPAIDLNASGTRREDALLTEVAYKASCSLRRALSGSPAVGAMEQLLTAMGDTSDNGELIATLAKNKF